MLENSSNIYFSLSYHTHIIVFRFNNHNVVYLSYHFKNKFYPRLDVFVSSLANHLYCIKWLFLFGEGEEFHALPTFWIKYDGIIHIKIDNFQWYFH